MNTILFNQEIDDIIYSAGFHYSYAKGPGKDYRSLERYDGLKYPIILRNCIYSDEREVGEEDCILLITQIGSVKLKIPYSRFTETFLKDIITVISK